MSKRLGKNIELLGTATAIIGGIALASIFIIVMINGSWPDFLRPFQATAQTLSSFLGGFVFPVEVAIFVGPGMLIRFFGEKLQESETH